MYGGVKVYLYLFLTSSLDGGEWCTSRSFRFTPKGKGPLYPLGAGLGGPQSLSGNCVEQKEILYPLPGIEPRFLGSSAHSLIPTRTELSEQQTFFLAVKASYDRLHVKQTRSVS
jgi:hypothetical protein